MIEVRAHQDLLRILTKAVRFELYVFREWHLYVLLTQPALRSLDRLFRFTQTGKVLIQFDPVCLRNFTHHALGVISTCIQHRFFERQQFGPFFLVDFAEDGLEQNLHVRDWGNGQSTLPGDAIGIPLFNDQISNARVITDVRRRDLVNRVFNQLGICVVSIFSKSVHRAFMTSVVS